MPKANHGPEPKAAPPSLVVMLQHHRTLTDPLVRYADFQRCIDRAKVLEERLTELHDAVEGAIQDLNEDAVLHELGRKTEEALARLNKVL